MTTYYSNEDDFDSGISGLNGGLYCQKIQEMLAAITNVEEAIKKEGLSYLYQPIGEAYMGRYMPESTLLEAEKRSTALLNAVKNIHANIMQNIDGKFVEGLNEALLKLNAVNEGKHTYKSSYMTKEVQRTYTAAGGAQSFPYGSSGINGTSYTYTAQEACSLADIIQSEKSPIPAVQALYQIKLTAAVQRQQLLKETDRQQYDKLAKLSDDELVEYFHQIQLGEHEALRSTFKEENKAFFSVLEPVVKIGGVVILGIGTVASGGAIAPISASVATGMIGTGTVLLAGDGIYEFTSGESISGRRLTESERQWAGANALMTILTGGSAMYSGQLLRNGRSAPKTVQDIFRGIDKGEDALDFIQAGSQLLEGGDPFLAISSMAGQMGLPKLVPKAFRNGGDIDIELGKRVDVDFETGKRVEVEGASSSSVEAEALQRLKRTEIDQMKGIDIASGTNRMDDALDDAARGLKRRPDADLRIKNEAGSEGVQSSLRKAADEADISAKHMDGAIEETVDAADGSGRKLEVTTPKESLPTEKRFDETPIVNYQCTAEDGRAYSKKDVEVLTDLTTHNAESKTALLGRFEAGSTKSYEQIAHENNLTYFDAGPNGWKAMTEVDSNLPLQVNEEFLRRQIAEGKDFILTADPDQAEVFAVRYRRGESYANEIELLKKSGYKFETYGEFWRAYK